MLDIIANIVVHTLMLLAVIVFMIWGINTKMIVLFCILNWYDFQNGIGIAQCENEQRSVHFSQLFPNATDVRIGESLKPQDNLFIRCNLAPC